MNLFPGRIETTAEGIRSFRGSFDLPVEGQAPPTLVDGPATLGIRPEQVQIADAQDGRALEAVVELVERVGPGLVSSLLTHLSGGAALTVRVDAASPILEGDRIFVRLPPAQLRLFDAAGQLAARTVS